jgi:hypothetical protein
MAAGDSLATFLPLGSDFTSSASAAKLGVVNGRPVLIFPQNVDREAIWTTVMPSYWDGVSNMHAVVVTASPASSGAHVLAVSFEANKDSESASSDTFDTETATTGEGVPGTPYDFEAVFIWVDNDDTDSVNYGDQFRFKLRRLGTDGNDTLANDLYVFSVHLTVEQEL